jgi:hypothetical protein
MHVIRRGFGGLGARVAGKEQASSSALVGSCGRKTSGM